MCMGVLVVTLCFSMYRPIETGGMVKRIHVEMFVKVNMSPRDDRNDRKDMSKCCDETDVVTWDRKGCACYFRFRFLDHCQKGVPLTQKAGRRC